MTMPIEVLEMHEEDVRACANAEEYLRLKARRLKESIKGFHFAAQQDAKSPDRAAFFLNLRKLAILSDVKNPSMRAYTVCAYWREACTLMVLKGLAFETALDEIFEEEHKRTMKEDLSLLETLFAFAKTMVSELDDAEAIAPATSTTH